jgi:hypothetical protein
MATGFDPWSTMGGLVLTGCAVLAVVAFYRGAAMRGTVALALAGIAMAWTLTAPSLPQAREFWVTPRMAEAMADAHLPCDASGLRRHTPPSMVFQFGTDTPLH